MSKNLLIAGVVVGLFIQTSANASFFSHGLARKLNFSKPNIAPKLKISDDYVDFSGEWVGSCDDSEDSEILKISVSPDLSVINLDGEFFSIDGMTTQSEKTNQFVEENNIHFRWSKDGNALLGTMLGYAKDGNLALSDLMSWIGKTNMFINNDKLNIEYNVSIFVDGEYKEAFQTKCIYSRK